MKLELGIAVPAESSYLSCHNGGGEYGLGFVIEYDAGDYEKAARAFFEAWVARIIDEYDLFIHGAILYILWCEHRKRKNDEFCSAELDFEDLGGEVAAEVVVVGDVEDCAGVFGEGVFEFFYGGEVEVGGGFVEDEELGADA